MEEQEGTNRRPRERDRMRDLAGQPFPYIIISIQERGEQPRQGEQALTIHNSRRMGVTRPVICWWTGEIKCECYRQKYQCCNDIYVNILSLSLSPPLRLRQLSLVTTTHLTWSCHTRKVYNGQECHYIMS